MSSDNSIMDDEAYNKGYSDGIVKATEEERIRIINLLTSKGILFVGGDGRYLYAFDDYDMVPLEGI